MMLAMVLPIVLFAQNNVSKQKLDRPVIENKPYKYEYVIIRGIIHQEMRTGTFDAELISLDSQKKKGKKTSAEKKQDKYQQELKANGTDIKNFMKSISKSRWAINFDFGRTKSKEAQLTMKNEFHSMIDALNFLGGRGFELVLSEVQKTPHGDMQIYYMRKPR